MAHDLNNALAPILLGVELLRAEHPGESELLESFQQSGKRAAEMVRQLLTFAKGAEGERVAVRPAKLVKEVRTIVAGTFSKDIDLTLELEPDLPTVVGDPTQIHQVLLNLCVNARDAMPDGGLITIGAELVDVDEAFASTVRDAQPGRYVRVTVSDTGEGMPPEVMDRMYDPFYTTKAPDQGTGLGLSTVLGIVQGHQGFLNVYSSPDEGSSFQVYLPADAAATPEETPPAPAPSLRGNGEKILIVDDERVIRSTVSAVLESLGFEPVTAVDGADGLMQASQLGSELAAIITDVHMPEMDGATFTRLVRRAMPDVPVIVATGRLDEKAAAAFASLDVAHHIAKPFTQDTLIECLKTVLRP